MTDGYALDWINLVVRWVHVITAIAWVGASFYFNWLLNRLLPPEDGDPKVAGQLWALHAGGFFHIQKRNMPSGSLPEPMHWFKWEAYWTWISGMALLMLMYYVGAERYLIDPAVADLSPAMAIGIGVGTLVVGTAAYDYAWRSPLKERSQLLTIACCIVLVIVVWALCQVFSGRGAYMHAGALLGTIMVANVAHVIMPSQRQLVDAATRGDKPDPELGRAAGLRSLHNNYLTLPVVFVMISAHYPGTYGHAYNWLILLGIFAVGAVVRHYFNVRSKVGNFAPAWLLGVGVIGVAVIAAAAMPRTGAVDGDVPPAIEIASIIANRCTGCHASRPTYPGFAAPPKGVVIETLAHARAQAPLIYAQAVATNVMPLGNLTGMTGQERQRLGAWIAAGAP
jgi:uncharacterized membrane protein